MKPPLLQRREALVLAGLLGAGGVALAVVRRFQPVGRELEPTPVVQAAMVEPGPEGGNQQGDVTLIVFTDFNCGACRIAHPAMMEAVEEDGGVRLRYLDWPIFGEDSHAAARTAIAADAQGLYQPVHAALMRRGRADAAAAESAVEASGGSVHLVRKTLATSGTEIDAALARNARHAFALGLGGTPGHLVGRVLVRGAVSRREFARTIRHARNLSR